MPYLQGKAAGAGGHHGDVRAFRYRAIYHAHVEDDPPVVVVVAIKDQGAGWYARRLAILRSHALSLHRQWRYWCWDALDDSPQHLWYILASLSRNMNNIALITAQQINHLLGNAWHIGCWQVNLVEHRDDGEVLLHRQVHISQRLRLDPLAGIHHQYRAFAGLQATRYFVAKIHVAGGVDQVEVVGAGLGRGIIAMASFRCWPALCLRTGRVCILRTILILHPHRSELDGNPLLALQIHAIEQLLLHIPLSNGARQLHHTVGQGTLAVVDMGDDAEIPNQRLAHFLLPAAVLRARLSCSALMSSLLARSCRRCCTLLSTVRALADTTLIAVLASSIPSPEPSALS